MAVTLPNVQLTARVRSHQWVRDARGVPMPSATDAVTEKGPFPCNLREQPDGSFKCRLDPRMWPIRQGDELTDGTRTWTINNNTVLNEVPGCDLVDFVAATAILNVPEVP